MRVDRVESLYTPDGATAANGPRIDELDLLETLSHDLVPMVERLHVEYMSSIQLGQYRSVMVYRNAPLGPIPGPALFYRTMEKT